MKSKYTFFILSFLLVLLSLPVWAGDKNCDLAFDNPHYNEWQAIQDQIRPHLKTRSGREDLLRVLNSVGDVDFVEKLLVLTSRGDAQAEIMNEYDYARGNPNDPQLKGWVTEVKESKFVGELARLIQDSPGKMGILEILSSRLGSRSASDTEVLGTSVYLIDKSKLMNRENREASLLSQLSRDLAEAKSKADIEGKLSRPIVLMGFDNKAFGTGVLRTSDDISDFLGAAMTGDVFRAMGVNPGKSGRLEESLLSVIEMIKNTMDPDSNVHLRVFTANESELDVARLLREVAWVKPNLTLSAVSVMRPNASLAELVRKLNRGTWQR